MALTTPGRRAPHVDPGTPAHDTSATAFRYVTAALRFSLGWIFLWAFLDKLFGLGHETASKQSWLNGGSPTNGFLAHATTGPFSGLYHHFAGHAWADWLFMLGLLGIGIALIAGVAMRAAAVCGVVLVVMMWSAVLPPENNVFMDEHIIYALTLVSLTLVHAGHTLGLGPIWERLPLVQRYSFLR